MNCLLGEIMQIDQISDIEKVSLDPGAWIFFDIDYTLTKPGHRVLQNLQTLMGDCRTRKLYEQYSPEQKRLFPIVIVSHVPNVLVSPDIPGLLVRLQEKGHTILGCTAADTSTFLSIGSVPEWREKELRRLGITFTQKGPPKSFKQFTPYRTTYPLFQKGVLYTNTDTVSKEDAMLALLDHLGERPPQIVLVDDSRKNFEGIEQKMEEERIPFLGFHFIPQQEEETISDQERNEVWDSIQKRIEKESLYEGR